MKVKLFIVQGRPLFALRLSRSAFWGFTIGAPGSATFLTEGAHHETAKSERRKAKGEKRKAELHRNTI
jgi:hypothetical protein